MFHGFPENFQLAVHLPPDGRVGRHGKGIGTLYLPPQPVHHHAVVASHRQQAMDRPDIIVRELDGLQQLGEEGRTAVDMIKPLMLEDDEADVLDEVKQIIEVPP